MSDLRRLGVGSWYAGSMSPVPSASPRHETPYLDGWVVTSMPGLEVVRTVAAPVPKPKRRRRAKAPAS